MRQTLVYGPDWHDSFEKHQENAYYAQQLEEAAIRLTGRALLALSSDIPNVTIVDQVRIGYKGLPIYFEKVQTHKRPDSKLGTSHPEGVVGRFVNSFAIDELIQIKHLSKDPHDPGDMSLIGVRPQLPKEIANMRQALYAAGFRQEFDNWFKHYCKMRPGILGLASVMKQSGLKKGSLEYYLMRVKLDEWYYWNASHEVDAQICFGIMNVGAKMLGLGNPVSA